MNIFIWILQGFLAILFFYSGLMKSTKSEAELIAIGQTGVRGYSRNFIRFIGITELLGAAGIILPWALNIIPMLTPFTACCFAFVMVFAFRAHVQLGEGKQAAFNTLVFLVCILVAIVRSGLLQ